MPKSGTAAQKEIRKEPVGGAQGCKSEGNRSA